MWRTLTLCIEFVSLINLPVCHDPALRVNNFVSGLAYESQNFRARTRKCPNGWEVDSTLRSKCQSIALKSVPSIVHNCQKHFARQCALLKKKRINVGKQPDKRNFLRIVHIIRVTYICHSRRDESDKPIRTKCLAASVGSNSTVKPSVTRRMGLIWSSPVWCKRQACSKFRLSFLDPTTLPLRGLKWIISGSKVSELR